jgi:hypothetical protein
MVVVSDRSVLRMAGQGPKANNAAANDSYTHSADFLRAAPRKRVVALIGGMVAILAMGGVYIRKDWKNLVRSSSRGENTDARFTPAGEIRLIFNRGLDASFGKNGPDERALKDIQIVPDGRAAFLIFDKLPRASRNQTYDTRRFTADVERKLPEL